MLAARDLDIVLGNDFHAMVVTPLPIPVPIPLPFLGTVFDPIGVALGAMMGGGGPVLVNGLRAGNTGTNVINIPHFPLPPATAFHPIDMPPDNDGTIFSGSQTVHFGGSSQARKSSDVLSCAFPVAMPTSKMFPIPHGNPVNIGGPEARDAMVALFAELGAALKYARKAWGAVKAARAAAKAAKQRPANKSCHLTGEPVDVVSGELVAEVTDFELGGVIMPIEWVRNYRSREGEHPTLPTLQTALKARSPALGPGWFHPFESWVEEEGGGALVHLRLPDGRPLMFEGLTRIGSRAWNAVDQVTLLRTREGYECVEDDGKRWIYRRQTETVLVLVAVMDSSQNRIDLHYERGYLRYVVDAAGRVLDLRWSREGRLESVWFTGWVEPRVGDLGDAATPPIAQLTPLERPQCLARYGYVGGELASAADALGHALRYRYQGGVMIEVTRKSGLTFRFAWDFDHPDGNCVRTWGENPAFDPAPGADHPLPRVLIDRRIQYSREKRLTIVEDGRGAFTHYVTNDLGLVDEIRPPLGGPIRFTYSPDKWKLSETDGLGRTTSWVYDERGRVVRETDSLGQILECSYDAAGNRTEIVAPGGALTSTTFDARRLPITRTNAAGDATRFQFDARGRPIRLIDPMGAEWTLEWTPRNDLLNATDPEGRTTTYAADELGRTVAVKDPMGRTLRVERDAVGQVVDLRTFEGERFARAYDAEGNLVTQTDGSGRTVRMAYGGLRNLLEHVDPMGHRVRLFYDTETDLVAVENQHRERYRFELDSAGRVVKETSFSGHRRQYLYDAASLVKRVVSGWGRVTEVARDALGRVVSTVAKGGERRDLLAPEEETFAFDPLGRLVSAKTSEAALVLDRDVLGRIVRERRDEHAIESTYDRAGYRTNRRTSLSHQSTYTRNRAGDLTAIGTDWSLGGALRSLGLPQAAAGAFELKFARDRNGQEIARRLPGGVSAVWARDAFGKPVEQRVVTGAGADRPGMDVLRKGYAWSAPTEIAGITSYDPSSGAVRASSTYDYDPRGHLVRQVLGTGEVIHRQADPAGNLFRSPAGWDRVYGKGGVLQKAGGTTYTFDDDGFLSEKVLSDGAKWVYSWSAAGRLREVKRPDGKKVAFAYDALGRRVRKAFDGRVTEYVWDGDDLVHERTTDTGGANAPLVTWLFEPGTFSPVAKIEGRKRFGVVSDHLGVPTALMTEAGKIAWQAQLDVYGVVREETPAGGAAAREEERTRNPWRFPGQYEDEETGLYYNRFRYYDPEIGRYLSEDPSHLAGGLAQYAYTMDPELWVDPLGLAPQPVDFSGSPELYPAVPGQNNIVVIPMQGSRSRDFTQAWEKSGIDPAVASDEYTWHHVADFNPETGTTTMQLVKTKAHRASCPHVGSVAQFQKHFGVKYDTPAAVLKAQDKGWLVNKIPKKAGVGCS